MDAGHRLGRGKLTRKINRDGQDLQGFFKEKFLSLFILSIPVNFLFDPKSKI
jgi:hypothetical protein